jgi:hypothetical protein
MALASGLAFPVLAPAQDVPTCATTISSVDLRIPDEGENAFVFEIRGFSLGFRPEVVIDFWTNGKYPDPVLVERLSNELPLREDRNLSLYINDLILLKVVADLTESGHAVIRNPEGELLQTVEVATESGWRCGRRRIFSDPESESLIFHLTDSYF